VATSDDDAEKPMAEKGGCLNLGWGCLPVLALFLTLPGTLLF
jgi:hypothetical protein